MRDGRLPLPIRRHVSTNAKAKPQLDVTFWRKRKRADVAFSESRTLGAEPSCLYRLGSITLAESITPLMIGTGY